MKLKRQLSVLSLTALLTISMAPSAFAAGGFWDAVQDNKLRRIAINKIADALVDYAADNSGYYPSSITTTATNIGDAGWDADICAYIVPTYVPIMGWDPDAGYYTDCATYDTGFTVNVDSYGVLTVSAPNAELGATITTTR